jgi:hypothetical protein
MATTTNYSWTTPDDTALVKDGAAAIRTLGSSVDTTTKALNPSTTLGDIEYRSSTANTNTRLPLGTAGQVLQVNSGATAPEWATISAGGMTLINTGGTTLTGSSVTISSIPGTYKNLQLVIRNFLPSQDEKDLHIRMNGDSGSNRHFTDYTLGSATSFNNTFWTSTSADNGTSNGLYVLDIYDYANTTTWKIGRTLFIFNDYTTPTNMRFFQTMHAYNQTSAITSIDIFTNSTSFTSGTAYLYGVK